MIKGDTKQVLISDEMRAKLDSLSDTYVQKGRKFTEAEDAIILEYYPRKNKNELSEVLGICENSLRRRYKELTKDA